MNEYTDSELEQMGREMGAFIFNVLVVPAFILGFVLGIIVTALVLFVCV